MLKVLFFILCRFIGFFIIYVLSFLWAVIGNEELFKEIFDKEQFIYNWEYVLYGS